MDGREGRRECDPIYLVHEGVAFGTLAVVSLLGDGCMSLFEGSLGLVARISHFGITGVFIVL